MQGAVQPEQPQSMEEALTTNMIQATTPGNSTWHFTFDLMGRKVSQTYPWGGVDSFALNAAGVITRVTGPTGSNTDFQYDPKGRITNRTLDGGQIESRTYNAA